MYDPPRPGDGTTLRRSRPACLKKFASVDRVALSVTGDVDLPAFVSNGYVYIQAPLPPVFPSVWRGPSRLSCAI